MGRVRGALRLGRRMGSTPSLPEAEAGSDIFQKSHQSQRPRGWEGHSSALPAPAPAPENRQRN